MTEPHQDPVPSERPDSDAVSSTGLDSKLAGTLCYLLGFISGVIFLLIEKQDREVRFHAYQALGTFGGLFVLNIALGFLPFIGWLGQLILAPLGFILWIVLMVRAFQGDPLVLPVVGEWAEEQAAQS